MIALTFNAADAFLLNDAPDWSQAVALRAALVTRKERGLSGREARQALGETLRLELDWTATVDRAAFNAFRDALQALGDEPVLAPVWPLMMTGATWTGASAFTGGAWFIAWLDDWSDYEIGASITTPADWDWVAPLAVGKLASTPECALLGSDSARLRCEFIEDADGANAVLPAAVTFATGAALADATVPKVFPFEADWRTSPKSGAAEVQIEREQLGKGRARAASFYPQSPERIVEADVQLTTAADVASLLRWWLDRRGSVGAHYAVAYAISARLASAAASGAGTITLTDADDIGDNRFVELNDGEHQAIVRITSFAGDVATLSANLSRDWPTTTMVRLALLARHARDVLELTFTSPAVAQTKIAWRELPAEYTVASGETRGTTLGSPTNARAHLYLVTLDWNGATEVHRFTDYERNVTASAQTWTTRPVEHGELRQNLALDRDETTLRLRWWEDCPFRQFLPNALDAKVRIAIYSCDVSGSTGSNVAQVFGGEITAASFDGPFITATAAGANALFDRKFPRILLQPRCNHAVFDAGCGLDIGDWTATAEVYAVSGATVTLENFVFSGSTPGGFGFAHWFALGYIERALASLTPPRVLIFDSAAISSGRIQFTLGAAPTDAFTVGESVTVVPGCDNLLETCSAYASPANPTGKFNNAANFLGFPLLPDKNPSFTPLKKSDSSLGKK